MVENLDPKNHGDDFFHITLVGQTLSDLRDHRYAALRMSNLSAESDNNTYHFYRELAETFHDVIRHIGQDDEFSKDDAEIRLNGPEALFLHRALVSRMEEAQENGNDHLSQRYCEYADEVRREINRAGGGQAIKLLEVKFEATTKTGDD